MELKEILSGIEGLKVKGSLDIEVSKIESSSKKIKEGDIILSHNGTKHTADSLEQLLKNIKEKGLEVVKVSELIVQENYTINNNGTQIKK